MKKGESKEKRKERRENLAFFTYTLEEPPSTTNTCRFLHPRKFQTPNKPCATRLIKIKSLRPLHQTQIFFKHFGDRIRGFNRDCNPKFHKYNYYFVHVFLSHLSQEIRVYKFGTPSGTISTSHLFFQFQNQPTRQTRWPLRRVKPFLWRKGKA